MLRLLTMSWNIVDDTLDTDDHNDVLVTSSEKIVTANISSSKYACASQHEFSLLG